MEDFVFIFFVIALVVVGIIVGSVKNQATNATYDRLARKHRGVLQPGGFFSRPTVQFSRDDARYLVNHVATGGKNKTYFTQVHVFGPLPQMRCEIYPEGMWSTLGKLVGMTDIEIGSFEFDRQYVIKGSTVAMLREVINAQVQVLLSRLRSMLGNNDIYMTINAGSMLVKKRGLFRDFRSLDGFVDTVLELHEAITATQSKGIEFVGESTVEEAIHDATCQVCGDGIHQNAVLCRRCHTPHHQECWEYYGACSTYGCRETQYRIPHNRNAPRNPEIIAKPVIRSPEEIRQREEDKRKKGDRYRRREGRRRGRQ